MQKKNQNNKVKPFNSSKPMIYFKLVIEVLIVALLSTTAYAVYDILIPIKG